MIALSVTDSGPGRFAMACSFAMRISERKRIVHLLPLASRNSAGHTPLCYLSPRRTDARIFKKARAFRGAL